MPRLPEELTEKLFPDTSHGCPSGRKMVALVRVRLKKGGELAGCFAHAERESAGLSPGDGPLPAVLFDAPGPSCPVVVQCADRYFTLPSPRPRGRVIEIVLDESNELRR